jgi:hypothetical protein
VESTDAPCYPKGDTHGMLNAPPDTLTGCTDIFAGGDPDFDGFMIQTDLALYGRVLLAILGYPEFEGPVQSNACTPGT